MNRKLQNPKKYEGNTREREKEHKHGDLSKLDNNKRR
jgi:hypothetical protein